MKLKRSNDRKVANSLTTGGNSRIANTFGLPAGREYSCPGATPTCSNICYAGKLEKLYPGVRENLLHNWNLLENASEETMINLINSMIVEFEGECNKWGAEKLFRIHWDGDFFCSEYVRAWRHVIQAHPEIQFWVYTRVESAMYVLSGLENLSLYFSGDRDNLSTAHRLRDTGFRIAMLGETMSAGKELLGAKGAKCPEQRKQIPLTGACVACSICIKGNTNMVFSISKKKGDLK